MIGGERGLQRVLAVRCPAWPRDDPGGPDRKVPGRTATTQVAEPAARAFDRVVEAVEQYCPRVEVLRPGICAFGTRGPARYFGGEAELSRKIIETVGTLGFECGIGVADGMFAALLASRDALVPRRGEGASAALDGDPAGWMIVPADGTPAFLAPRSVTVLGAPDLADLLVRLGMRTLGEFAALSAVEAEHRFGSQGLLAHRLACGLDPRPLVARLPAADLSVQLEFDPPAELSEQVVFAAKSLAAELHAGLASKGLACVRLQIQVIGDDGQEITRLWRHDGLLSELAVAERVRWQLDGWRGRGSGDGGSDSESHDGVQAGGISQLRLTPDQLVRHRGRQLGLWGDEVVSDKVARAAVRVQAMLGHGAVLKPVPVGGRNPADQAMLVPFGDARTPLRPADRPWPGQLPAPAPATVYPVPRPALVTDSSGQLVTVTGRGQVSADPARLSIAGRPPMAITAWTGPWPVTERWWDPVDACRKARFQLVTMDGSAWLAVVRDASWLIEASYD